MSLLLDYIKRKLMYHLEMQEMAGAHGETNRYELKDLARRCVRACSQAFSPSQLILIIGRIGGYYPPKLILSIRAQLSN